MRVIIDTHVLLWALLDPQRLSRREREICQLLSQGYANKEIARELGLSTRTVENRLHLLYQKLGVHSRTEFMAWAARQSAKA